MDERKDARTDGRTWATLNALPHSTNSGGIKMIAQSSDDDDDELEFNDASTLLGH